MAHTGSPEGIEALRDALAERYSIRECCGQGGMASVYRAVDLRHHRDVAIKVLVPQVSSTLAVDRFLREIQIAAGLSHPHILPVFDSGEAAGMLYYVMPYVEGQTLRDRLDDGGPLPVNEVVRLGIELTDALEYAHARGVVHRDVKPANILLQGSHATIADFGLARAIRAAGDRQLTSDGWAVGTPLYMSPEQALGGHDVDGRTDIYALGCVLFEALTGVPHGADPTLRTLLGQSAASPAERRAQQLRHVPSRLRYALNKATATLPEERFASARDFGTALSTSRMRPRRAAMVAAGSAILGIAVLLGGERLVRSGPNGLVPNRVVVASLGNRTGSPELASLGEMAADWVTQGLERSGLVDVVPTATVRNIERHVERAEPGSDPAFQVASQTRAGLIVSGDIYREGDSLLIHVQLTNARQNRVAGSIDPVLAPVHGSRDALMTQLRSRVMGLLAVQLDARIAGAPGASARPPAFEAYRRFNEGMELYSLHRPAEAVPHFKAARELDSGFVQAWLFEALMLSNVARFAEADSILDAVDARRDELSPHDRHWLDYRRALLAGRRDEALRAIRDAARLAPVSRASYNLAVEAMEGGRLEEALESLGRLEADRGAMQGFVPYLATVATINHLLARHDDESDALRRMRELYPNDAWVSILEAAHLAAVARPDQAVERIGDVEAGSDPRWNAMVAARYVGDELQVHGQTEAARDVLARSLVWWASQPRHTTDAMAYQIERIEVLRRLGRLREADTAVTRLLGLYPNDIRIRTLAGVIAAARHDTAGSQAASDWLANRHERYLFGLPDFGRARIAAVAGDRRAAIALLRSARSAGRPLGVGFHQEPDLASLRGDTAFQALATPWVRR